MLKYMDNTGATKLVTHIKDELESRICAPNLLDNWYFLDPINQVGTKSFDCSAKDYYTCDRWISNRTIINFTKNGLEVKVGTDCNNGWVAQRVPSDMPGVVGNTVTFSAIIDDKLFSISGRVPVKGESPDFLGKSWTDGDVTYFLRFENLNSDTYRDICTFQIWCNTKEHMYTVKAAKLEVGSHQTLAHKEGAKWVLNDTPPNKTLELLKCQRHNLVLNSNGATYGVVGHGVGTSTTVANIQVPITTEMRANPLVTFSGKWCLSANTPSSDHKTVTKMTFDATSSSNLYVSINAEATGLTAGTFYRLCADNDTTARITLNANL